MRNQETFTLDWAYVKQQAREAWRIYFAPIKWLLAGERRSLLLMVVASTLLALALTGCTTTRYVSTYCLTRAQFERLKAEQPPKVHSALTGNADRDSQILAGSLIRVRSYSDGLLQVLGGCVEK